MDEKSMQAALLHQLQRLSVFTFLIKRTRHRQKTVAIIGKARKAIINRIHDSTFETAVFGIIVRPPRIPITMPPTLQKLSLNGSNPIITIMTISKIVISSLGILCDCLHEERTSTSSQPRYPMMAPLDPHAVISGINIAERIYPYTPLSKKRRRAVQNPLNLSMIYVEKKTAPHITKCIKPAWIAFAVKKRHHCPLYMNGPYFAPNDIIDVSSTPKKGFTEYDKNWNLEKKKEHNVVINAIRK